jgi:hypothetical protein
MQHIVAQLPSLAKLASVVATRRRLGPLYRRSRNLWACGVFHAH